MDPRKYIRLWSMIMNTVCVHMYVRRVRFDIFMRTICAIEHIYMFICNAMEKYVQCALMYSLKVQTMQSSKIASQQVQCLQTDEEITNELSGRYAQTKPSTHQLRYADICFCSF